MPKTEFNIVIVGSGNMANALGDLFSKKHNIVQVVSRNVQTGKKLAARTKSKFTQDVKNIYTQADFYFLCVPDDEIVKVSKQLKQVTGVLVHHSGAKPMAALKGKQAKAVIYPFVSVHTGTDLNQKDTVVFYDVEERPTVFLVKELLDGYKFTALPIDDRERLKLHLAAVLVNNFTNHLYYKAATLTGKNTAGKKALVNLAQQALNNFIHDQNKNLQTGPARRNDKKTVKKHLELVKKDRELTGIYLSLSRSILKTYQHE